MSIKAAVMCALAPLAFLTMPAGAFAGDIDAPKTYSLKERCAHPELFLSDTPLSGIKRVLRDKCKEPDDSDKVFRLEREDCWTREYLRNAIFASYGKKFRKKKWKKVFGMAVWYTPRDSFKNSDVSAQAWKNVKTLQASCKETAQFRRDKKLLKRWVSALQANNHKRASKMMKFPFQSFGEVEDGCKTLTKASADVTRCLTGWREAKDIIKGWKTSPWVIYSNRPEQHFHPSELERDGVSLEGTRVMHLNFAPADLACEMNVNPAHSAEFIEDCGAFGMSIAIFISKSGKIVGSHWNGGAACPFVYVEREGELHYQGEILRNLVGVKRRATQSLPIAVSPGASEVVIVLAEEKQEITFADDAVLEIGGLRLRPQHCADESDALCARDESYYILRRGEQVTLRFVVPDGTDATDATLEVTGFYVPRSN